MHFAAAVTRYAAQSPKLARATMGRLTAWQLSLLAASLVCFALGASPAAVTTATSFAKRFAKRLSPLENIQDFQVQSLLMLVVYILQYLALGGVFEGTNPKHYLRPLPAGAPAAERAAAQAVVDKRREQVYHEMRAGVLSLVITVALAVLWMYVGEPRTAFYGFFEERAWSPWWALGGVAAYVASFDTWFYWSHLALHEIDWVWHSIHYFHHQYKEPSAFAQFAVHPVEAALQGPVGHFLVQLWFPVHPVQLAVMGFLSSAWAFAAHDGRWGDFNSHVRGGKGVGGGVAPAPRKRALQRAPPNPTPCRHHHSPIQPAVLPPLQGPRAQALL